MSKVKKLTAVALVLVMVCGLFAACSASPQKKLIGAWRDSTGNFGYEFRDNNTCKVTFVDTTIPFIQIPIKGDFEGSYSVSKGEDKNDYITVTYSIYAKTINQTFMFKVEGETLTLTNKDDGQITTLIAYTQPALTTTAS